jgi:hypothetical protein
MKEKKIIAALSSLDVYELNSFRKFAVSPYFNVNPQIIRYVDLLLSELKKSQNIEHLNDKSMWSEIYEGESFNEQRFRKLNSDMVKLFEQFLAQEEFENSASLKINLKLEGIRKKNIDKLVNGVIGEVERLEKMEMNKSAEYYLYRYLIERNLFNLTNENEKKTSKSKIERELNIQEISRNLDYFYIAEKIKYYCTVLSWQKMYNLDIALDNIDIVLEWAKKGDYPAIPPIALYSKIHDTFIDRENEVYYKELKSLIAEYIHMFPPEEMREIYYTAISYCIDKVNKGNLNFQNETFFIYKEALLKNVLLIDNYLSPSDFRNIVFFALRVSEFDWAEHFIENYSKHLEEKSRDNAVYFSMARLDFYRKNYWKVIEHLQKVNYEDVWYNIGSKSILIFTYYELDEYDALESLLQAFRMYIDREKSLSKERKQSYLHLINFTRKLIRINPKDKEKIIALKENITETKGVVSKPWLLEKIEELE